VFGEAVMCVLDELRFVTVSEEVVVCVLYEPRFVVVFGKVVMYVFDEQRFVAKECSHTHFVRYIV